MGSSIRPFLCFVNIIHTEFNLISCSITLELLALVLANPHKKQLVIYLQNSNKRKGRRSGGGRGADGEGNECKPFSVIEQNPLSS